jgi:hypothetical protein
MVVILKESKVEEAGPHNANRVEVEPHSRALAGARMSEGGMLPGKSRAAVGACLRGEEQRQGVERRAILASKPDACTDAICVSCQIEGRAKYARHRRAVAVQSHQAIGQELVVVVESTDPMSKAR